MTDISYRNWDSMSNKALSEHIGAFVKHHRLDQNKTHDVLAYAAGIIEEIYYTVSQWNKFADKENVSPELRDTIADNLIVW